MKPILLFLLLVGVVRMEAQLPGFSSQPSTGTVCEGLSFNSDEEAFSRVKQICEAMDIAGNFMVAECGKVDNCKAVLNSSGSYIFYNNNYLHKIKGLNFTESSFTSTKSDDWDVLFILAHEIGHHVLQHLANFQQLSRIMPLVDMELEADKFAGACLFRMGATLEQAQHVMYDPSVSEKASLNHPARKERLEAIAIGYNKAKAKSQGVVVPPSSAEKVSDAITKLSEGKVDEAISELEKNAENSKAWGYLGYAYCSGSGVPKDMEKGIKYYTMAADSGDFTSQFNVAVHFFNGDGIPVDKAKALKYYTMAAEQGDADAQYSVGMMHLFGDVGQPNYEQAADYLERAAAQDHPQSIYYLGIKAFDGQGEPVNHSKAAGYFERAAQLNLAEAQMMLGQMYENGLFYTANLETAKKYYLEAAKQDNEDAIAACARLGVVVNK